MGERATPHNRHEAPPHDRQRPGRREGAPAVWGLSEWSAGMCFRCDRTGIQVTRIGTVATLALEVPVRACRACVFQIEQAHWAMLLEGESPAGPSASARTPDAGAGTAGHRTEHRTESLPGDAEPGKGPLPPAPCGVPGTESKGGGLVTEYG